MRAKLTPIMIFVKDFERCLEFYQNVFELKPMKLYQGREHSPYVEFQVDNDICLALHGDYDGPAYKQGTPIALHFDVEDVHKTIERVKQYGGRVIQPPRKLDFRRYAELQIVEDARVTDPDGNELELRHVLLESNP
jgi:predicted enzyme related to lactoylglutathione lyase